MSAKQFNRSLADALTFLRFIAAGLVWAGLAQLFPNGREIALAAFLAGALSDFFDGYLARMAGGYTAYGKILDPLADKALTLAAFAGLAAHGLVGWWFVVLVAARDVIVTAVRFRRTPARSGARDSGKWKTTFQMLFIISALLLLVFGQDSLEMQSVRLALLWGSVAIAALTLWSGLRFLIGATAKDSTRLAQP